jgi:hypothetical protein
LAWVFVAVFLWLSLYLLVPTLRPPHQEQTQHQPAKPAAQEANGETDKLAIYTLWLAIFTGGLVVVAGFEIRLLVLAERTASETARATKDLADAAAEQRDAMRRQGATMEGQLGAAVTAAAAAKATVDKMDETAKRELRAYITVGGLGIKPLSGEAGGVSVARIEIKNVGRVAAHNVRWIIYAQVDKRGSREGFDIDETRILPSDISIAPTVGAERRFATRLEAQERIDFSGGATLYVWGIVRYVDGMTLDKIRFTRFCHRYDRGGWSPNMTGPNGEILASNMRYHQFGNDAD